MLADITTSSGIYRIVSDCGRQYIGSAKNLRKRCGVHWRDLKSGKHHSRFMQRVWNKRGEKALRFEVVLRCRPEHLLWYEQRALDVYKPEFNTSPTAGSQLGYRHSDDTRAKMSASRPRDFSPMTGRHHSDETKRKVSLTKTGVKYGQYSADRVQKTAAAMRRGKGALTEEQVRAIRKMKQEGRLHREVAIAVGCSYSAVADIARGRTFSWVT